MDCPPRRDPEEVAAAFTILHDSGKVRHFGVSNQNPMQIELLKKFVKRMQPILGTTNPQRVKDASKASDVKLSRQEWYEIYLAAGNKLP